MSVIFPPAILGRKWPRQFCGRLGCLALSENPHARKIPLLGGVLGFLERGGGSANFIVMGAGIFLRKSVRTFLENCENF